MTKRLSGNNNFYHIYNRGVDKRIIYKNYLNYLHFIELMKYVNQIEPIGSLYHKKQNSKEFNIVTENNSKLVEIIAYSLLPNHFHLLVKEVVEGGISKFMQKIGIGYTNHFNYKNKRSGYLFQGKYKLVKVNSDYYLNYLSAYIYANSEIHNICKAEKYKYSNYNLVLSGKAKFFNKYIMKNFANIEEYNNFLKEVVKNAKKIKQDKKIYTLE